MVTIETLMGVFTSKLKETGSLDDATRKTVWIAYNEGLLEGMTSEPSEAGIAEIRQILKGAYDKS